MTDLSSPTETRRWPVFLAAVVLAGVAAQLFLLTRLDDLRVFMKYWELGDELRKGLIARQRLNDVSPLYLWLVAALRSLGFTPSGVRVLQIVSNGLTAFLAARLSLRLAGPLAAGFTVFALILNRSMFINATELEPESVILLLNTTALFLLFGRRRADAIGLFFAGVCFGLSSSARLVALPAAMLMALVVVWWRKRDGEHSIVGSILLPYLAGILVPLSVMIALTFHLTGHPTIMNPGTVFYEGWNPHSTGYALTEPLVVSDVRAEIDAPDALHLSYRLVASRAGAASDSPEETNRFWTGKALAFMKRFPSEAAVLALQKLFFSIHSYDAWDLPTMVTRGRQVEGIPWIPFAGLVCLAVTGGILHRRNPLSIALFLYSVSYAGILVAFYVTSRQRNAVVAAVAILAGVGFAHLVRLFRDDRRLSLLLVILVAAATLSLTRNSRWQIENAYNWTASFNSEVMVSRAREAERGGGLEQAMRYRAIDRIWILGDDPHIPSAPRALVSAVAKAELAESEAPQRLFDLAIALQYAGDWGTSETILELLDEQGYRPIRKAVAVDSVAYYRALALLHQGDRARAEDLLKVSSRQAPADPHVLALRTLLVGDEHSRTLLFAVHDRLTAKAALARAHLELGHQAQALELAAEVEREIPEWNRIRLLREVLADLAHMKSRG